MSFLSNTFLHRVYCADKKLFGVFALYTLGILYFSLQQREEFPFLLYGMYSLKEEAKPTYTTYQITIDGKVLETTKLKDAKAELVTSPLSHIAASIQDGKTDTSQFALYANWLLKYIDDGKSITIHKLSCSYKGNGEPTVTNTELLYDSR